jgi:integrase
MPRKAKELSALVVSRLSDDGFHVVGNVPGLGLHIAGESRSWVLRFSFAGRRPETGLGSFPEVSLAHARQKARDARELVRKGINPIDSKQAVRRATAAASAAAKTFGQCAANYIDAKSPEWLNVKHLGQWRSTIETFANPTIGNLLVRDVDTPHVMAILEPIWKTKTETAVRLRGRLESILDWATVRGYRSGLNPARWKGHLSVMLPAPGKVANAEHHAALPYAEMPGFMARLRAIDGESAQALQFAILTAARSGEVRGATWREVDFDAKAWTVPAERMKAKKPHRVPLSHAALQLLRARPDGKQDDLIFASSRNGRQLSDMAMTATVRRMQVDAVPHGLARATFKTWATECTSVPREVIETALAHTLENKTEEAYWRGDLFDKRVRAMHAWAEFLNQPARASSVTPIRKNRAHR